MTDLLFCVMATLAAMHKENRSARYGYAICRRLAKKLNKVILLASVYRVLKIIEDAGWVVTHTERHRNRERRCYTLTRTGRVAALGMCREKQAELDRLQRLIDEARQSLPEQNEDP